MLSPGSVCRIQGVPPLLPGDKANGCLDLAAMMGAKFGQTKELSLNLGKQTVYGLNCETPAVSRGFCLTLYI